MARASGELSRRRLAAEVGVVDFLQSWSRTVIRAALIVAAIAGVLLLGDRPAAKNVIQERTDHFRVCGSAESDDEYAVHETDLNIKRILLLFPAADLMHGIDQSDHMVNGRLRQNAVAEVENVARASSGLL